MDDPNIYILVNSKMADYLIEEAKKENEEFANRLMLNTIISEQIGDNEGYAIIEDDLISFAKQVGDRFVKKEVKDE